MKIHACPLSLKKNALPGNIFSLNKVYMRLGGMSIDRAKRAQKNRQKTEKNGKTAEILNILRFFLHIPLK